MANTNNFTDSIAAYPQRPNTYHQQCNYSTAQYHSQEFDLQAHDLMLNTNLCQDNEMHSDFTERSTQRRAKRSIPDMEKDAKYWEKRKRNNLAAKRSRENKKSLEHDIRDKVSSLEEENALLRKEIFSIKNHYRLSQEGSVLTPEEREQCKFEVRNAQQPSEVRRRRNTSVDTVSSTSQNVSQPTLQPMVDEQVITQRESLDLSYNSPKVKEENPETEATYGPAIYGPFQPSPCWTPVPNAADFPPFYEHHSPQNYPSRPSQSKVTTLGNASSSTENNSTSDRSFYNQDNFYIHRNMGRFVPTPYAYYMHYANQSPILFGNYNNVTSADAALADAAPADLSMNRNKSQKVREVSAESGGETLFSMSDKTRDVSSNLAQPLPTCAVKSLSSCDVSTKDSSLGQAQIKHEQFRMPFKLPAPISATFNSSQVQSGAKYINHGTFKSPNHENLRRDNEIMKKTTKSFREQIDIAKDQAFIIDRSSMK